MIKLKILFLAAMIIGVGAMTSCSKSNNSTPAKADSVLYSDWIPLNMTPTDAGDTIWTQSVSAASITSAIVNKGTVIGYFLEPDPITGDSSIADVSSDPYFSQNAGIGTISLVDYYENIQQYGFSYRYVAIPGTIQVTDQSGVEHSYTAAQLKLMNYQSVAKILNLPRRGSSAGLKVN